VEDVARECGVSNHGTDREGTAACRGPLSQLLAAVLPRQPTAEITIASIPLRRSARTVSSSRVAPMLQSLFCGHLHRFPIATDAVSAIAHTPWRQACSFGLTAAASNARMPAGECTSNSPSRSAPVGIVSAFIWDGSAQVGNLPTQRRCTGTGSAASHSGSYKTGNSEIEKLRMRCTAARTALTVPQLNAALQLKAPA
jgi:hypothetical protein